MPEKRAKGKKAPKELEPSSSTWETVCTTLDELKAWAKKLKTAAKCGGGPADKRARSTSLRRPASPHQRWARAPSGCYSC